MACERSAPITWAQQEWFNDLGAQQGNAAANSTVAFPVPRLPIRVAEAAINDLVGRHEGLRTHIEIEPDGQRLQVVCGLVGASEAIQFVEDGPAAEAALAAASATVFQLEKQWPVLFVVMTDGDVVTRIGVVADHVAIDAWGWKVLSADLDTALRARADGRPPFVDEVPVEQPVDSAQWESGPAGERQSVRAVHFWRGQLDALRDGLRDWTPSVGAAPPAPVLRSFRLCSARTATAAQTLSDTAGIRASALYLQAFAAAVAEVEGAGAVGIHALTANRLTPGVQASVRKAVMPAPVVVSTHGSFADRLSRTATAQLEGFRFANVHPAAVATLTAEILGDRQGSGAVAARFNFLDNSVIPAEVNDTSLGGENIRFTDPAVQGRVTADPPRPGGSRYILSVQHQPRGAMLTLACHEDTAWARVAESMLWHIEDLMVWTAAGCTGTPPRFGRDR
jgi:hypothetical protein